MNDYSAYERQPKRQRVEEFYFYRCFLLLGAFLGYSIRSAFLNEYLGIGIAAAVAFVGCLLSAWRLRVSLASLAAKERRTA